MFKLASADAVVLGEGEITTLELVKAFLNNENLDKIKGIAYQKNKEVIITEPRDFIEDLDTLLRKIIRGRSNMGDVRYSSRKLLETGFTFKLGLQGAVSRIALSSGSGPLEV